MVLADAPEELLLSDEGEDVELSDEALDELEDPDAAGSLVELLPRLSVR